MPSASCRKRTSALSPISRAVARAAVIRGKSFSRLVLFRGPPPHLPTVGEEDAPAAGRLPAHILFLSDEGSRSPCLPTWLPPPAPPRWSTAATRWRQENSFSPLQHSRHRPDRAVRGRPGNPGPPGSQPQRKACRAGRALRQQIQLCRHDSAGPWTTTTRAGVPPSRGLKIATGRLRRQIAQQRPKSWPDWRTASAIPPRISAARSSGPAPCFARTAA